MDNREDKQHILDILQNLDGLDALKDLFWSRLSYDRVNQPLSRNDWSETAKNALSEDPVLWASGGDGGAFHVIYARLASDRLPLGMERPVVTTLLREHPYALFVFSNDARDRWHFVNVRVATAEDQTAQANRDPLRRRLFRRITVGPEERLRTAAERIAMLDLESIRKDVFGLAPLLIQQRHDEAFDVETVTRRFYDEYRALFDILQGDLSRQTGDRAWAHDFALQLLNRCMFIYFVQRKRWLNHDPDFLNAFWTAYQQAEQPPDTFYARWLNILFFEAFNEKFHGGHRHFPEEMRSALQLAPYLNGGLFSENDLDREHDGVFTVSDTRFLQILTFLDRYNFTISEDTPLDQEVAVDAEMLGKVYESLVNVSEETDERGDAGIFYTPRTEIDMMCRLALVDHLTHHLGEDRKTLLYEAAFAYTPDEKAEADKKLSQENLWPELDALLQKITVVDPACGSGSFLIGMLQALDDLVQRASAVTGRQETSYERRKRIIGQSLYGVDVMRWAVEVAELRLWLQLVIETELDPAELKFRPLLPNLSFKVRQGDSLAQAVGGIDMAHVKGTQDIPGGLKGRLTRLKGEKLKYYNHDPSAKYRNRAEIEQEEYALFRDILESRAHDLSNRLKQIRQDIETTTTTDLWGDTVSAMDETKRRKTVAEASALQTELDQTARALDGMKRAREAPFVWDIAFVEIFDGDRSGFDIVVGNPPYVRQESISDPLLSREDVTTAGKKAYKDRLIRSVYTKYPGFFGVDPGKPRIKLNAKSDLYIYFFFHGLSLLNEKGAFCFITSNSWLDVGYGRDLQEFLLRRGHIKMIIDNRARRSFASADVNTVVSLLAPPNGSNGNVEEKTARFVMFTRPFDQILDPVLFDEIETATERKTTPEYRLFPIEQGKLYEDGCEMPAGAEQESSGRRKKTHGPLIKEARYIGNKWGGKYLRAPDIYWTILEKGKGKLVRLGDIAEVRFGIKTGANEFFYLDDGKIAEWGIEAAFLKPVIKSPRECRSIVVRPEDLKFRLFMCHEDRRDLKGANALAYIEWGEAQGFHERPSCRGRQRWWDVGERKAPPVVSPSSMNDLYRAFINESNVFIDKRLYEVYPSNDSAKNLAISLNTTLMTLFLELGSRTGLGEGLVDLTVYEVAACFIVNPSLLPNTSLFMRPIGNLKDELHQPDRRALDEVVFDVLGLSPGERAAVYEAVVSLVRQRLEKARSV